MSTEMIIFLASVLGASIVVLIVLVVKSINDNQRITQLYGMNADLSEEVAKMAEMMLNQRKYQNIYGSRVVTFKADTPAEMFDEIKRQTGIDIKPILGEGFNTSPINKETELCIDGHNRAWYISELTKMNKIFDEDSSLTELRNLYLLF